MAVRDTPNELDVTDEAVPPGGPPVPVTVPYDPTADQENVRGRIAYIILSMFTVMVLGALASSIFSSETTWKQVAAALGLLLAPVVALVGAVTGFYYGEKSGKP